VENIRILDWKIADNGQGKEKNIRQMVSKILGRRTQAY
jgi:hypothetical protein